MERLSEWLPAANTLFFMLSASFPLSTLICCSLCPLCSSLSFSVSYFNIQLSSTSSSTCPWLPAGLWVFSLWWGGQMLSVQCCFQFFFTLVSRLFLLTFIWGKSSEYARLLLFRFTMFKGFFTADRGDRANFCLAIPRS